MLTCLLALFLFISDAFCASINATVSADWSSVIAISKTTTTLQVVVNALLTRQSPIHDQTFKSLAALNASFVRIVPWDPYPKLAVAQLYPPSGEYLCGHLNGNSNDNNWTLSLSCPDNSTISEIKFASWGNPTGNCGSFKTGNCSASTSMNISEKYCLHQSSCTIPVNVDTFGGDPCKNVQKQFSIQVECSKNYNYSNWDFSLIDPLMEDLMNATNPTNTKNKTIINFSTIPNWYYGAPFGEGITDNQYDTSHGYNYGKANQLINAKAVGEYYGNLISYYKNGWFEDQYGNNYTSGYNFEIDTWEVLNEVNYEHSNTPQSYTLLYDAIVQGIQAKNKNIKFVGLAMGGWNHNDWYSYFLNSSNHASDIPIDYISFHFYTHASNRTDPNAYEAFFPATDTFIKGVKNITKIRAASSYPNVKFDVDEIGVILPGDNQNTPNPPPIYWNAAAAMFAYLFPHMAVEGVDIIGQSQLMGYPPLSEEFFPASPGGLSPQYASVTEIDWETGVGNARYWLLKLLIDHFQPGDKLVNTTFTENTSFYGQGFIDVDGNKKILIVNKLNQEISATFTQYPNGGKLYVIDIESGNGPAYVYDLITDTFYMRAYAIGLFYPS